MHPLLRNRNSLIAYALAWLPLGGILGGVLSAAARLDWRTTLIVVAPCTVLLAIVCLTPWYLCKALPLRSEPVWKIVLFSSGAAMLASSAAVLLVPLLLPAEKQLEPGIRALAGLCFLFYLLSIALHYMVLALETSRRAEVLSREAELKALKAQVNPHFLFNSLNSISALTAIDPARARDMCVRLSDFLRTSLRLGERSAVPFGEELALAKAYLDVEKIRFGQRLRIEQDCDELCRQCQVPPLILQPLIENAIKHGVASLTEGGDIHLAANVNAGRLIFSVDNPFDPDAPPQLKSGIGLANVRNRVQTRYGKDGGVDVQVKDGVFHVQVSLPFIREGKK